MNMMSIVMFKERRDIRPLLLKCGVALAISFVGFLYSRIRVKRIKPSDSPRSSDKIDGRLKNKEDSEPEMVSFSTDTFENPCRVHVDTSSIDYSPTVKCIGDKEGLLLPEFNQLVREFGATTVNPVATFVGTSKINKESPKAIRSTKRGDYEHEIENLKKRIKFLTEREKKLEFQLFEYYGAKEHESVLTELQNRLKISYIEAKFFSMRIDSLQSDNRRLESQVADHSEVALELEAAKMKIKQLKKKIRHEAEQSKEQIIQLAQRVANLKCQEDEATNSAFDFHLELHRLKELELDADELRNSNEKLQLENDYLAQRLESTQILANSVLEDTEKEELYKEMFCLKKDNENLSQEVERLQSDRCADVEELVYLRWINACLRYELRNYQPPPGITVARDLSKCLSPTSEQKAKRLILEYANHTQDGDKEPSIDFDYDHCPSSQPSYLTDDHDGSPSSSSSKKHQSKKMKIFAKLRRLVRGKHGETSPIIKSHSLDELGRKSLFEHPHHNSCDETGTDYQRSASHSPMLASSSQNSNNSSLEYHQVSNLAEDDSKHIKSVNRTNDCSSSQGGVRFVLGRTRSGGTPLIYKPENEALAEDDEKSELAKYAEALRDSRERIRKKSASFTSG